MPRPPRILLLVVLALIAYATLFPFNFSTIRLMQALHTPWWRTIFEARSGDVDVIANLFFYVPLGYVLFALRSGARHSAGDFARCLAIGACVSTGLEFLQFAVPRRNPSISDIALNSVGTLLGACLARVAQRIRFKPVNLDWVRRSGQDSMLLPLLVAWIVLQAAPFIPRLGIYRAVQAMRPLLQFDWTLAATATQFALYLLALTAMRTAVLRTRFWRGATLLCLASLSCQVLVISHTLTLDAVLGCSGALLTTRLMRQVHTERTLPAVFVIVLAAILVGGMAPFGFSSSAQDFQWVPFSATLEYSADIGFFGIMRKVVLYSGCWWAGTRAGLGHRAATLIIALSVTLVEMIQIFVRGRVPEITDPLLVLVLAAILSLPWLNTQHKPAREHKVQSGGPTRRDSN